MHRAGLVVPVGGRKPAREVQDGLGEALDALVESVVRGDPSVRCGGFRGACVISLPHCRNRASRRPTPWRADFFASNRQGDRLAFRDLFRHGTKHGLIEPNSVKRWLRCGDNRDDNARNYGEGFAEATLKQLPTFIAEVKALTTKRSKGTKL